MFCTQAGWLLWLALCPSPLRWTPCCHWHPCMPRDHLPTWPRLRARPTACPCACRNATYSGALLAAAQAHPKFVEGLERQLAAFVADKAAKRCAGLCRCCRYLCLLRTGHSCRNQRAVARAPCHASAIPTPLNAHKHVHACTRHTRIPVHWVAHFSASAICTLAPQIVQPPWPECRQSLSAMPREQRAVVHQLAEQYGLATSAYGQEPGRYIELFKTPSAGIPARLLSRQAGL